MPSKDPFDHPFFKDDINPWERGDKFDKTFNKAYRAAVAIWVTVFVASSALAVGIIWVAWHFISKFW